MKKGLQTLALSIFLLIPFLVKAAPPSDTEAPAVAEGSTSIPCSIDSGSIPSIIYYAANCFGSTVEFTEPECTIHAANYRSYCSEVDHESAETCLARHHCSAPRTPPATSRPTPTPPPVRCTDCDGTITQTPPAATAPTTTPPVATAPTATPPAGPTFTAPSSGESGGCSFSAALPANISLGLFASFFLQILGLVVWRFKK